MVTSLTGNSALLYYMPRKRTLGNLSNEVPFFLSINPIIDF